MREQRPATPAPCTPSARRAFDTHPWGTGLAALGRMTLGRMLLGRMVLGLLALGCAGIVGVVMLGGAGCVEHRTQPEHVASFEVVWAPDNGCGQSEAELCVHSATAMASTATIRALREDGSVDTEFTGTVTLSLIPSGIFEQGLPLADGRRVVFVPLVAGEARDIPLSLSRAFGEVRLLVEDLGYEPAADVLAAACHDLYPDPGCYARDDNDPEPGSGAAGVSDSVWFANPRLYDIQYTDQETVDDDSGWPSPLAGYRPTVDGDSRSDVATLASCDGPNGRRELLVVTATTVDGFNVTDVCNAAGPDFASLYVYNFHTPEGMVRGDCLLSLTGTIEEFQGFTEMKNPFWEIDCDPADPSCASPRCVDLLPDPVVLDATTMGDGFAMEGLEAGLVVLEHAVLASEFRSCDLNGNGAISGSDEWNCQSDCGDDPSCVVLETYQTYFQFTVHKDGQEINVVTRGTLDFDPEAHLGEEITRIVGTVRHLDFGHPPWTLLPRDEADFVL